jgi:hypothetical protein
MHFPIDVELLFCREADRSYAFREHVHYAYQLVLRRARRRRNRRGRQAVGAAAIRCGNRSACAPDAFK